MLFFMEFIYLLTLCIDFSLPLAALASGMLLKQVIDFHLLLPLTMLVSGIVVSVVVNTYHFASN